MATLRISANEKNFIASLKAASGAVGQFTGELNSKMSASFASADYAARNFNKGIYRWANELRQAGQNMTLGLTVPLGFLGKSASDAYAEMDSLKQGLKTLEPTVESLNGRLSVLRDIARQPGIGFSEAIQGDVRLRSVGISAEYSAKMLREFSNAIATTGGGKAQLNEVTIQLGQMIAKGKVLSQDLRPIIEAAPTVATALKNIYGTVSSDMIAEKLEAEGKTSLDMIKLLLAELEKAPRVTGGWKNSLENLSDSLKVAKADVFGVADKVFDLNGKINSLEQIVSQAVLAFTELDPTIQKIILGTVGLLAVLGPTAIAVSYLSRTLAGLTSAAGGAAFAKGGLVLAITAILGVVSAAALEYREFTRSIESNEQVSKRAASSVVAETTKVDVLAKTYMDAKGSLDQKRYAKEELIKLNPAFSSILKGEKTDLEKLKGAIDITKQGYIDLAIIKAKQANIDSLAAKYERLSRMEPNTFEAFKAAGAGALSYLTTGDNIDFAIKYTKSLADQRIEAKKVMDERVKDISDYKAKMPKDIYTPEKNNPKVFTPINPGGSNKKSEIQKANEDMIEMSKKLNSETLKADLEGYKNKYVAQKAALELEKSEKQKSIDASIAADKYKGEANLALTLWYAEQEAKINRESLEDHEQKVKAFHQKQLEGKAKYVGDWAKIVNDAAEKNKKDADKQAEGDKERAQKINQDITDMLSNGLADALVGALSGKGGFQQAMKSMLNSFGSYAIQLGTQILPILKIIEDLKLTPSLSKGVALIAGGVAVKAIANSIKVPAFAQGGMVNSPILSMLGDNASGKEMVLPFEKTGEFASMISKSINVNSGSNTHGNLVLTTRVSGNDLELVLERYKKSKE